MIHVHGGGDSMDSILTTIKKMLGIEESYEQFDPELIGHINSSLTRMYQLGLPNIIIIDKTNLWSSLLGTRTDLEFVKTLIYLKVRLVFDPPATSFLLESINKTIDGLEWQLNIQIENGGS
jgi:hypothetical protein